MSTDTFTIYSNTEEPISTTTTFGTILKEFPAHSFEGPQVDGLLGLGYAADQMTVFLSYLTTYSACQIVYPPLF